MARRKERRSRISVFKKLVVVSFVLTSCLRDVSAHSGPPFPIATDQTVNGYKVSVWTDPDATDDRTAVGRFWVTVTPGASSVTVSIKPLDRAGAEHSAFADAVNGDIQRRYAALVIDHEGRYGVHVAIDGPRGPAALDAYTDATYDMRPRPALTIIFVLPFVLVGFVWGKLLLKRRMHGRGAK